jgi:hypothetical protein
MARYVTFEDGSYPGSEQCSLAWVFMTPPNYVSELCNALLTQKTKILRSLPQVTKLNSVALVRKRTIPTERPQLVGEVVPTFADRRCRVVSATNSHGR